MDASIDDMFGSIAELHKQHCKLQYRIAHVEGVLRKTKEATSAAHSQLVEAQTAYKLSLEKQRSVREKKDLEYNRIEEGQEALMKARDELAVGDTIWKAMAETYGNERKSLAERLQRYASDTEIIRKKYVPIAKDDRRDSLENQLTTINESIVALTKEKEDLDVEVNNLQEKQKNQCCLPDGFPGMMDDFTALLNHFGACEDVIMGAGILKETGKCWNCADPEETE
uniref:Uncharacterized protein n=1 Tax=Spongospora subterranea TaxID=70186 RepID=A0A0H5R3R4_9EUKA|eukprot:CRZ02684.1 hypothetical protein [Spongospora subterranea]